jgi:hypothetical protein
MDRAEAADVVAGHPMEIIEIIQTWLFRFPTHGRSSAARPPKIGTARFLRLRGHAETVSFSGFAVADPLSSSRQERKLDRFNT